MYKWSRPRIAVWDGDRILNSWMECFIFAKIYYDRRMQCVDGLIYRRTRVLLLPIVTGGCVSVCDASFLFSGQGLLDHQICFLSSIARRWRTGGFHQKTPSGTYLFFISKTRSKLLPKTFTFQSWYVGPASSCKPLSLEQVGEVLQPLPLNGSISWALAHQKYVHCHDHV